MTITQHQHQPQPQDNDETTTRLKKDLRLRVSNSVARQSKTTMATTTTIQRIQAVPTTPRTTTKTTMTTTTTTTRTTHSCNSTTKRLSAASQWFGLVQCVAVLVWSWTSPFVVQAFTTRTQGPHAPPRTPRFLVPNPSAGSIPTAAQSFSQQPWHRVTSAAVRYQSSQRSRRTRLGVSMSPPPHPGSGKSSSSSSSLLDEYDVIVLYPKSEIPFFLQETPTGQAAFAGYVQYDEPCSTIRNVGDVVVSIDGLSTQGLTIHKLVQLFQEKARNCAYSFVRFRSCVPGGGGAVAGSGGTVPSMPHGAAASSSASSSSLDPLGQLPGEQRRNQLELEIAHIDSQVQLKLTQVQTLQEKKVAKEREVRKLDQLDLDWIEQKKRELQASFDEDEEDDDETDRDEAQEQGASQDSGNSSKKPKTKSTTPSSSSPSFPNSWNPGSSAAKQADPQPHFAFTNKQQQQPSGANTNNKPPSWPSAGGGGPPPPRSGP